jgi:hypothetical protein
VTYGMNSSNCSILNETEILHCDNISFYLPKILKMLYNFSHTYLGGINSLVSTVSTETILKLIL